MAIFKDDAEPPVGQDFLDRALEAEDIFLGHCRRAGSGRFEIDRGDLAVADGFQFVRDALVLAQRRPSGALDGSHLDDDNATAVSIRDESIALLAVDDFYFVYRPNRFPTHTPNY